MSRTVGGADADSLERSSSRRADSIRFGPKAYGVERAEVNLSTCAFSPHRHDTYAIGVTTAGVQTFGYRGSRCVCLPGQLHVLHPDEAHDGAAGTDDGFSYRILYIAPELIRGAPRWSSATVCRRSRPGADSGSSADRFPTCRHR